MSKPIENCPQPDEPMRDRAWTAEQKKSAETQALIEAYLDWDEAREGVCTNLECFKAGAAYAAALAQNAQGEAVACIDARHLPLLRKGWDTKNCLKHPSDAGDGDVLLYLHAERARVPATDADIAAWAERHDLSFGGSKIDARSAFEDAETLHLAADPSLRAEDHRDLQLGEMKRRACIAHTLCYELSLRHPEIPELGDDGKLHCAIHDILAVDTPSAKVGGPMPGGAAAQDQPEDASHE
jgi:hypothetical protein